MGVVTQFKRLVPRGLRRQYHRSVTFFAGLLYGRPSRHLVVIGVTGTDGKTTTASLIADVLGASGTRVGLSTSAVMQVGDHRWLNESHMTMPGRFALQRMLRQMVDAKCSYAVLEMSSEGLAQYRHSGIDIDVAVITNLTPEHIESHGSFEAYRNAKGLLFASIIRGGDKRVNGKQVPKVSVVNLDDASQEYFLQFWAERHYGTTLRDSGQIVPASDKLVTITGRKAETVADGMSFAVDGQTYTVPLRGAYQVRNALQAVAIGRAFNMNDSDIARGLASAHSVPGRAEYIDSGRGWQVVVDYALTPHALTQLYESLNQAGAKRIIGVFGAAGGGRDAWKRPELGKIAAQYCASILLTTDDPYDEEPAAIAAAIAAGVPENDKRKVEILLDRREAITKAMSVAQPGDIIAITGMGSETSMMVKGKKVEWSDTGVVHQLLRTNA